MLDRPVAQPVLDRPRVVPLIGQGVAAGVPEHVDVHRQADRCFLADALDQAIDGIGGERRAALIGKHKGCARRLITPQLAQRPQLVAADWMRRRFAVLRPVDCSVAVSKSTWDHSKSHSSVARRPCL
jgi:hypothetical protein